MNEPTYASYLADQGVRAEIERAARRARAAAVSRLMLLPLLRFCGALLQIPTVSGPRLAAR